jgi:hypothetical protein
MSRAMSPQVRSDQAYPPAPIFCFLDDIMGGCLAFIKPTVPRTRQIARRRSMQLCRYWHFPHQARLTALGDEGYVMLAVHG